MLSAQVKQIRLEMKEEYDIPEECNEFLKRCLRMKDGNIEKAKNLVKEFYSCIKGFQSWAVTLRPSSYMDIYNSGFAVPLKQRDSNGSIIIVVRPARWDVKKTTCDQMIACIWMLSQYVHAKSINVQRNGFVTIWDFGNYSLQQVFAVKIFRLLALSKMVQNGVAGRMKAFHGINHNKLISAVYSTIKPFLKEKLTKRVNYHNSQESFLKHVDVDILPTDLGGTVDPQESIDLELLNDFFNSDLFFQGMVEHGFPNK